MSVNNVEAKLLYEVKLLWRVQILSIMIRSNDVFIKSTTKKGFSSKEIQRQYGLKSDERVWAIVLKLRKIMGIEMSDIRLEE